MHQDPFTPPPASDSPQSPVHDLTVLVIRHGEKPDDDHPGLDEQLRLDPESLTARGWDRALKLPSLFGPSGPANGGGTAAPALPLPATVFASAPGGPVGAARRHAQTVTPLAEQLGLKVRTDYGKKQERELAEAVLTDATSPVLICWQHSRIPKIVRALGADAAWPTPPPDAWPSDRFDLVWVLRRNFGSGAGRWTFRAVDQGLLDGDR
ncbi:hypothetical protein [Streptomyces sp. NPDC002851]